MAYYQCFKTTDRTVYCSSQQFRSHATAALWVAQCVEHFAIPASDLRGRPFEADSPPSNAVIWP